jgi:hypothetical protein
MAMTEQLLKKLQLLQALIEREEMGDEVIEMTISKLLSYELEKLRRRQGQIQAKLTAFEAQYHLIATEFSRKFKEGKMGDAMDFFEWSALADMHQNSESGWPKRDRCEATSTTRLCAWGFQPRKWVPDAELQPRLLWPSEPLT